jgi:hypothetical protein
MRKDSADKILQRLMLGKATKPELVAISGTGSFTARISDLRRLGYDIRCVKHFKDDITVYELEN